MRLTKKTYVFYAFVISAFTLGIGIGFMMANYVRPPKDIDEFRAGGHKFINRLYECNISESIGAVQFKDLERSVSEYIDDAVLNRKAGRVAVYFRDLNNGPWFGINENLDFSPASLLKIPIMIAYLKREEFDPDFLKKKIFYKSSSIPTEIPLPNSQNPIVPEKEYSLQQLLEKMIIDSDNSAATLLKQNIPESEIDRVKLDLGISTLKTLDDYISVRDYSSLFRILFNASYLNPKSSEKALELLSKSGFNDGLRKPIPTNVYVAHKFGERHFVGTTNYQLHDCGIVYYNDRPYLLCIMTQGTNQEALKNVIQDISKIVYEQYKKLFN